MNRFLFGKESGKPETCKYANVLLHSLSYTHDLHKVQRQQAFSLAYVWIPENKFNNKMPGLLKETSKTDWKTIEAVWNRSAELIQAPFQHIKFHIHFRFKVGNYANSGWYDWTLLRSGGWLKQKQRPPSLSCLLEYCMSSLKGIGLTHVWISWGYHSAEHIASA